MGESRFVRFNSFEAWMILRDYVVLNYIFSLVPGLVESAESFWGRPCAWRCVPVNQAITVFFLFFFFSLVLIIAETEPAEPDMQTDRLKENVSPGTKRKVVALFLTSVWASVRLDWRGFGGYLTWLWWIRLAQKSISLIRKWRGHSSCCSLHISNIVEDLI